MFSLKPLAQHLQRRSLCDLAAGMCTCMWVPKITQTTAMLPGPEIVMPSLLKLHRSWSCIGHALQTCCREIPNVTVHVLLVVLSLDAWFQVNVGPNQVGVPTEQ